jgi:hypothetical protein
MKSRELVAFPALFSAVPSLACSQCRAFRMRRCRHAEAGSSASTFTGRGRGGVEFGPTNTKRAPRLKTLFGDVSAGEATTPNLPRANPSATQFFRAERSEV